MFKNTENFKTWLTEILKPEYAELLAGDEYRGCPFHKWLEEVESQANINGSEAGLLFEVSGYYTKDGNPRSYDVALEIVEIEPELQWETTCIF